MGLKAHEGIGELVNRIIRPRHGAVAPGIAGFEPERGEGFLPDLHGLFDDLALAVGRTAAAFVDGELGLDQVALVGGQPLDPVEGAVGFFAASQRDLHRPLRPVPGLWKRISVSTSIAAMALSSIVPRP